MPSAPLLRFQDVGYAVTGTVILHNVTVALHPGEVLGVSGPNGAGKTTLLRLMATLAKPKNGQYDILGITPDTPADQKPSIRRNIAYIGHTPALWPDLTLRENLTLIQKLREDPPTGHDPLQAVGLAGVAERRAAASSLGMQKRAEFAQLLTWTPHLLLLDEPHVGLDDASAGLVDVIVDRVVQAHGAVVIVSHDLPRAEKLLTRQAHVQDGALHHQTQPPGP